LCISTGSLLAAWKLSAEGRKLQVALFVLLGGFVALDIYYFIQFYSVFGVLWWRVLHNTVCIILLAGMTKLAPGQKK